MPLRPVSDTGHLDGVVGRNDIALDPRSIEEREIGNIVLGLARTDAATASDAFVDIDPHAVKMPAGIVLLEQRASSRDPGENADHASRRYENDRVLHEFSTIHG